MPPGSVEQRQDFLVQRPRNSHAIGDAARAGIETPLRRQPRALRDDRVEHPFTACEPGAEIVAEEYLRVEGNHEFAMTRRRADAIVELHRLLARHVADQRTAEQFDHRCERRALVPAERAHGALQRDFWIGGRLAVDIDRPV